MINKDTEFFKLVKSSVADYENELNEKKVLSPEDVYIVWYCKTLQNWKALVSTPIPNGKYYELTLNGDKNELYLDSYVKEKNKPIKLN